MLSANLGYWKTFLARLMILTTLCSASFLLAAQALSQTQAPHNTVSAATKSGLHNTINATAAPAISRNWSGYAAVSGSYTAVTGTWNVPRVTSSKGTTSADATWVGIGGVNSNDLIQSGTQNIVSPNGQITTLAFFEVLPNAAQSLPVIIRSGDTISVSLTTYAPNQWHLAFQDITNGQAYATNVSYSSSLSSVEWIEEAPSSSNRILPLDHFGIVQFSGCSTTAAGRQVNIAQSNAQPIILASKSRLALARPSSLNSDGASFSVTRA